MDIKSFAKKYDKEIKVGLVVFVGLMILQLFKSLRK
jgi:hypothetical protein